MIRRLLLEKSIFETHIGTTANNYHAGFQKESAFHACQMESAF